MDDDEEEEMREKHKNIYALKGRISFSASTLKTTTTEKPTRSRLCTYLLLSNLLGLLVKSHEDGVGARALEERRGGARLFIESK